MKMWDDNRLKNNRMEYYCITIYISHHAEFADITAADGQ
jgi:hypothetical protein